MPRKTDRALFKAQSLQAAMADLIHDPRFQRVCDVFAKFREFHHSVAVRIGMAATEAPVEYNQREKETLTTLTSELKQAVAPIKKHPPFVSFVGAISDLREGALGASLTNDCISNARTSQAALGEVRAYDDILAVVKNAEEGGLAQEEQT